MAFLELPREFLIDRVIDSPGIGIGKTRLLAELEGPGCIRHIWMATQPRPMLNRQIIIRIYWDGEEQPSVEAPLGDFFGLCHGIPFYEINSRYLSVQSQSGLNCYFPMPFAKSARIEVESHAERASLYHHIDWHRYPEDSLKEDMRFHAKWRREYPTQVFREEYLVMDAVGRGRLLGFVYGVRLCDDTARWSHGGAESIYIDGELEPCFVHGSGGEDTFGTSYGGALHTPETHLYVGIPYYHHEDVGEARPAQRLAAYRFFEEEAIPFRKSVHFRFGCVANDICSTAYWYQTEPHREFFGMPTADRLLPGVELERGECDIFDEYGGEWWLCGPFENAENEGMKRKRPPEQGFDPDATYDGGFMPGSPWIYPASGYGDQHTARWVKRRENHRFIDFRNVFRPWNRANAVAWPAVACGMTWLEVDHDTTATLSIAWDDELKLQINDDEMALGNNWSFRRKEVKVDLRKGKNRVMVKLSNTKGSTWGAWCYAFSATLPDGSLLTPRID